MSRPGRIGCSRERGFALLIVLWSLVLLAVLGAQITAAGRTQTQLASNLRNQAVTEAAADGAVYETVFHLLGGGGGRWAPSGRYRLAEAGVAVEVRIENLAGRVNPNVASPPLLRALLMQVGADQQRATSLTDAILDWINAGQNARPRGAKAADYRAAGRDYGPPGAPLRSLDELGAVLGMTPELLGALRPHLTLWWGNDPDPAAADPVVLAALKALGAEERRTGLGQGGLGQAGAPLAVDITATATGPGGSRFVRHAVVGIAAAGGAWRVLAWDS